MVADCLIIGGGVIGLSLAWELAQAGAKVRLLDRRQVGEEASWAGAGMLPPGSCSDQANSQEHLQFLSCKLHAQWSVKLLEVTGIHNGYRPCGAIYLDHVDSEEINLAAQQELWTKSGIESQVLTAEMLAEIEPTLKIDWARQSQDQSTACFLPAEAQIRNPRHLKALRAACLSAGVQISTGVEVEDFVTQDQRITGVLANGVMIPATQICVTSGCWSASLTRRLGISVSVRPIRGQIALLEQPACKLKRIINVGPRYLVPRGDGLILIGSTMEDVGFDRGTTVEGIRGLLDFACEILPELSSARLVRSWSGLRPGTLDGLPYMGTIPGFENAYIATGHFRAGLCLSAASAVVMRQLMQGEQPEVDLTDFRVDRI